MTEDYLHVPAGFSPRPITGAEVVACARGFLGTRFEHQGEAATGLDCSGLTLAVGKRLGQIPQSLRRPPYTLRPSPGLFLWFAELARPVPLDDARPGDILVMSHKTPNVARHVAFLTEIGLLHIHPSASINYVAEHSFDLEWTRRIMSAVRFKGVLDEEVVSSWA